MYNLSSGLFELVKLCELELGLPMVVEDCGHYPVNSIVFAHFDSIQNDL